MTEAHTLEAPATAAATSANPPLPGQIWAAQGGIYTGVIVINGAGYHLVFADAASGEFADLPWGDYGIDEPGAKHLHDGLANTNALLTSGTEHPAIAVCRNTLINGHADWYVPAIAELKLGFVNARQHFDADRWYLSSTQCSRYDAFVQHFDGGNTYAHSKDWSGGTVRLARRIPLNP